MKFHSVLQGVLLLAGCSGQQAPVPVDHSRSSEARGDDSPHVVVNGVDLSNCEGKEITVVGQAKNGPILGPVIDGADLKIYIAELKDWPPADYEKTFRIKGTYELLDPPKPSTFGEGLRLPTPTIRGSLPIVKNATWEIVDESPLLKQVGEKVSLTGETANAVGGAVILCEGWVYIGNLKYWPTNAYGKKFGLRAP
jgi:hypothetical protein